MPHNKSVDTNDKYQHDTDAGSDNNIFTNQRFKGKKSNLAIIPNNLKETIWDYRVSFQLKIVTVQLLLAYLGFTVQLLLSYLGL